MSFYGKDLPPIKRNNTYWEYDNQKKSGKLNRKKVSQQVQLYAASPQVCNPLTAMLPNILSGAGNLLFSLASCTPP